MLISTHVLVGTALGRALAGRVPAPVALAVGVASHFACDAIPHWGLSVTRGRERGGDVRGREFLRVAVPDGLTGLGLLAAAVAREPRASRVLVGLTAIGACLPDADKVGEFALGRSPFPESVDGWHRAIQRESRDRLAQDVAIAAALAAALLLRRRRPAPVA